ncbi:MAG: 6-bladed beta-propeller [Bacteroidetes bacterium]|jgi:hypothetical protein|nr:6-bladed beta-propeller [Bacteroidota bacterium]
MNRVLSLLLVLLLHTTEFGTAQDFKLKLNKVMVIGEAESDSIEYLFGPIRHIRTDYKDNILIAETSERTIRVFNRKGKFIRRIGGRGRGPGEFYEISSIDIGPQNEIIVFDRHLSRITIFDDIGNVMETILFETDYPGYGYFVYQLPDKSFLLSNRENRDPDDEGYLLYHYDQSLEELKDEYANVYDFFLDPEKEGDRVLAGSPFYKHTKFAEFIAFTPRIYTGTVGLLHLPTMTEKRLGTPIDEMYELISRDEQDRLRKRGIRGISSYSNQTGSYIFKKRASTLGLVGNEDYLLHFYREFDRKQINPFMTVYDSDGNQLKKLDLSKAGFDYFDEQKIDGSPYFFDNQNRLYIYDYDYEGSYPAAIIYESNLDELRKNEQ